MYELVLKAATALVMQESQFFTIKITSPLFMHPFRSTVHEKITSEAAVMRNTRRPSRITKAQTYKWTRKET